jgi:DNA end-binding protein Ku
MEEAGVAAIGRLVRSGRESLCLVRARGKGLVLETLYLVEDVYSQAEIDEAMDATEVKKTELDLARQIVEGLQASFEPDELSSDYRRDLRELLEAKLRGEEISIPEPTEEPAPAVDLIEALKASVAAAKATSARPKKAAAAKPKAEKRPARKAARK